MVPPDRPDAIDPDLGPQRGDRGSERDGDGARHAGRGGVELDAERTARHRGDRDHGDRAERTSRRRGRHRAVAQASAPSSKPRAGGVGEFRLPVVAVIDHGVLGSLSDARAGRSGTEYFDQWSSSPTAPVYRGDDTGTEVPHPLWDVTILTPVSAVSIPHPRSVSVESCRGVAQPGQSASFGSWKPEVRILSPRFLSKDAGFLAECLDRRRYSGEI